MSDKYTEEFRKAHPELSRKYPDLSWLRRYEATAPRGTAKLTNVPNIAELWERDKDGYLVDVTARAKAEQAVFEAQEELMQLKLLTKGD